MSKKIPSGTTKKWIAGAIGKPGALHQELGIPPGEKIPTAKLKACDKGNSTLAKEARLAETLRRFKH